MKRKLFVFSSVIFRIFVFVLVFAFLSCFLCFSVSAADDYLDPNSSVVPDGPTYNNHNLYYENFAGNDYYVPLYDLSVVHDIRTTNGNPVSSEFLPITGGVGLKVQNPVTSNFKFQTNTDILNVRVTNYGNLVLYPYYGDIAQYTIYKRASYVLPSGSYFSGMSFIANQGFWVVPLADPDGRFDRLIFYMNFPDGYFDGIRMTCNFSYSYEGMSYRHVYNSEIYYSDYDSVIQLDYGSINRSSGVPIYIYDFRVDLTFDQVNIGTSQMLYNIYIPCTYESEQFHNSSNTDTSFYRGYLTDTNYDFLWIIRGVSAILDVELFGYFSLGGIVAVMIAFSAALALLNMFKGST